VKIVAIGGGPASLYFAILTKKADPSHEIVVLERNRPDGLGLLGHALRRHQGRGQAG